MFVFLRLPVLFVLMFVFSGGFSANIHFARKGNSVSFNKSIRHQSIANKRIEKPMTRQKIEEDTSKIETLVEVITRKKDDYESLENSNYALLAQYLWPTVCQTCLEDWEQVT